MKKYIEKIVSWDKLKRVMEHHRVAGNKIVFTNGCFDILHVGHLHLLQKMRDFGDVLVVAVNSDASVKKLNKGPERPINSEKDRAELLAALQFVDYVVVFEQETPHEILKLLRPDILAKGGDWGDVIIGREIVEAYGGQIVSIPIRKGFSTSTIIEKIFRGKGGSDPLQH